MAGIIVTGLDFRVRALNAAIVALIHNKPKILAFEHFEFSADIFTDNGVDNYQDIVRKLIKVKYRQPLFHHRAAIAIPENAVMSRIFQTDKRLPEEQRRLSATHQFATSSPLPIDELVLDFVETGQGMLVCAAKRKSLEQRCRPVRQAGMHLSLVDSEKQAFLQLLIAAQERLNSKRILLEITEHTMTIAYIHEHEPFYRHLPLVSEEPDTQGNIQGITARLGQELERVGCFRQESDWDGIWFIGQLDHDDLITQIAVHTGLSVDAYPVCTVFSAKRSWQPESCLPMMKACGIALRGINAVKSHYAA